METILVADDEAQVRSLARDILLSAGYRVLEAEDGEQALHLAEEHSGAIHVLLTDLIMPGINGKELADRLAAARTDTKMIFMSGRASEVISDAGVGVPRCASGSSTARPFPARPQSPDKSSHAPRPVGARPARCAARFSTTTPTSLKHRRSR
jgi:CheY-like chemotaxis protein